MNRLTQRFRHLSAFHGRTVEARYSLASKSHRSLTQMDRAHPAPRQTATSPSVLGVNMRATLWAPQLPHLRKMRSGCQQARLA